MAWPDWTAENYLSGEGAKTLSSDSSSFLQGFYDRDIEVANRWTYFEIPETSFTDTSLTTQHTVRLRVPGWVLSGETITLVIKMRHSVGSVNGSARIQETDTTTNGTTATPSLTTSDQEVTLTIDAPDDTWAGTFKTFAIQASVPSGTGTIGTHLMGPNLQFGATA